MPTKASIAARALDPTLKSRICTNCDYSGLENEFGKGSHKFRCLSCNRKFNRKYKQKNAEKVKRQQRGWALQKNHGITLADYDDMFNAQEGKCAICGTDDRGRFGYFDVDHDHNTGKLRALLCGNCNRHLGWVEAVGVDNVAQYLCYFKGGDANATKCFYNH